MIGVVGPAQPAAELASAIDAATVVVDDAEAVVAAGPSVVVAIGDAAVSRLVRAGVDAPVLPVETSDALDPVGVERVPETIRSGLARGFVQCERPVLETRLDGAGTPAVFEAMLVTTEPARISEYTVEGGGWADRFRADGVVVSTPAGSAGYSRTLGGPVVDPDAGGLVVVPVAPFRRRSTDRVADEEASLAITVERDEGDVSLLVDGQSVGLVSPGEPVPIHVAGTVSTVVGVEG